MEHRKIVDVNENHACAGELPSTTSTTLKKTIFDVMPFDTCTAIADFVARSPPNLRTSILFNFAVPPFYSQHALSLSKVSPRLLDAVRSVCSSSLDLNKFFFHFYSDRSIDNWNDSTWHNRRAGELLSIYVAEWKLLLLPVLRHLVLTNYCVYGEQLKPEARMDILLLLSGPSLRRVEVSSNIELLQAIASSVSIRDITIRVIEEGAMSIFEILQNLRLTSLKLICHKANKDGFENDHCSLIKGVLSGRKNILNTSLGLYNCCSNLTSFSLTCHCETSSCLGSEVLRNTVRTTESIRDVTIDNLMLSPETIRTLRHVDSVCFTGHHPTCQHALLLKSNLTVLKANEGLLDEQIIQVQCCERLRRLDICLKEFSGAVLADALSRLKRLHTLRLDWEKAIPQQGEPLMLREDNAAEIFPGLVLEIVKAVPSLRELFLSSILVSESEVIAVLKQMGKRLEKFHLPLPYNGPETFVPLENILKAAFKHSPSLRILYTPLVDCPMSRELFLDVTDSGERAAQKTRLLNSLKCLKRKSLMCNTSDMEYLIEFIFEEEHDFFNARTFPE